MDETPTRFFMGINSSTPNSFGGSSWWLNSPTPFEKHMRKSKLDHFPQKIGMNIPIFVFVASNGWKWRNKQFLYKDLESSH